MKQKAIVHRNDHFKKTEPRDLAGGLPDSYASEFKELKHFVLATDRKPEVKKARSLR